MHAPWHASLSLLICSLALVWASSGLLDVKRVESGEFYQNPISCISPSFLDPPTPDPGRDFAKYQPQDSASGTPTHEPLYGSPHTYINREPKNDTFIIFESASVSLIFSRLLLIFGFPLANPHHWHCDGSQALSSNIRRCACRSTREHRRPTLLSLYSGVQPQMVLRPATFKSHAPFPHPSKAHR